MKKKPRDEICKEVEYTNDVDTCKICTQIRNKTCRMILKETYKTNHTKTSIKDCHG